MTRKVLILALITAGLIVAATSAAFGLDPSTWFAQDPPAASSPATPATSATTPAPVPTLHHRGRRVSMLAGYTIKLSSKMKSLR